MADKRYLGIYLTSTGAAVALAGPHGRVPQLHSCFWSPRPEPQTDKPVTLADEVSRICAERQFAYESSALALDRGFYSNHRMRSQFRELSRIAETVKFDAEEALTVDTSSLAITFDVLGIDEAGADLSVYAAEKKSISAILSELQAAGLDPLTFEPDSVALARFLDAILPAQERTGAMYVFMSAGSCYLVTYVPRHTTPHIRTFLSPAGAVNETLFREITLTLASLKLSSSLSAVRVFDQKGRVDFGLLGHRLGVRAEPFDLITAAGFAPVFVDRGMEPVMLAIACGAAMADFTRGRKADFRDDFSPYLGRTIVVDKTIKVICLALAFIVLAVGLYFQLKLFVVNRDRRALVDKLAPDYQVAMRTQKVPALPDAVNKLGSELRAVKEMKSGMLTAQGQETVTGLLTYVLEAINGLPPAVDLQLDQVKVTPKSVTLSGSTNKPENTLALLKKVGDSPYLTYTSFNQQYKNGRDEFGVTILPKRRPTGGGHASQNR